MSNFVAVILAAGKSTRMKSAVPKPLHNLCGKPVTRHVIDACLAAGARKVVVVVGHEAGRVKEGLGQDVSYALQREQLGTGHACAQAKRVVGKDAEYVLVVPGDTPAIRPDTLRNLCDRHVSSAAVATVLTAVLPDGGSYGRVVRRTDGSVERIVEARDASPKILEIGEINTSVYCFDAEALFKKLRLVKPENDQEEYYLTDVIELLVTDGRAVSALPVEDPREVLGINTRVELAESAKYLCRQKMEDLMLAGVTIIDPESTWVDVTASIGSDTIVHPFTVVEGETIIGDRCAVGPFAHIVSSTLEDGSAACFCRVVRRTVEAGGRVGPFENMDGESLSAWFAGMRARSRTDGKH